MNVVITILYVAIRIIIAFLTLRLGMKYAEQGNAAYTILYCTLLLISLQK